MRPTDWKEGELDSLLKTLRRHASIIEAAKEHNKIWKTGRTTEAIARKLLRSGLGGYSMYLNFQPKGAQVHEDDYLPKLVAFVKSRTRKVSEICDHLDLSPKRVNDLLSLAKKRGYRLRPVAGGEAVTVDSFVPGPTEIRRLEIKPIKDYFKFGVISDTHHASRLHMQAEEEDFVAYAYKQGVREMFHSGDVLAGINMYPGQGSEIISWGMEEQVKIAVDELPQHKGLRYHILGGNHDESFLKAAGADPLERLAALRPDVIHYGYHLALIDVFKVRLELHHLKKAGAYAQTYHLQKAIEAMPGGMKPQILLAGHTHTPVVLPSYRNVAAFQCGCFEGQTRYLKRMHIDPVPAAWILTIGIDEDGSLRSIMPEYVHYYHGTRYTMNPTVGDAPSTKAFKVKGREGPKR